MAGKMFVTVACALAGLGVAACGGDSGSDSGSGSGSDFAAQADQICIETQRELVGIAHELGPITSDKDVIPRIEQFTPVREQALEDLEALEPPEEAAASFEEMIELRRERLALSQEDLQARKKGDTATIERLGAESEEISDKENVAAEEAGLTACAGILPEEDAEQAKETITELEVSDDPALCTETMTEEGVESLFGGLEECEKTQKDLKPSELADSVTFEEVTGVEGVSASITGTVEGGALDGDHAQYELIYEDGLYKVNTVFAAPPAK